MNTSIPSGLATSWHSVAWVLFWKPSAGVVNSKIPEFSPWILADSFKSLSPRSASLAVAVSCFVSAAERLCFASKPSLSAWFLSLCEKALSFRGLFRLWVLVNLLCVSMLSVDSLPSKETLKTFSSLHFSFLSLSSLLSWHSTSSSKTCALSLHSLRLLWIFSLLSERLRVFVSITLVRLSLAEWPRLKQS